MDNKKKKRNWTRNDQNPNTYTEVLNTKEEKRENNTENGQSEQAEKRAEVNQKRNGQPAQREKEKSAAGKNAKVQQEKRSDASKPAASRKNEKAADSSVKPDDPKGENNKGNSGNNNVKNIESSKATLQKEDPPKRNTTKENTIKQNAVKEDLSKENSSKDSSANENFKNENSLNESSTKENLPKETPLKESAPKESQAKESASKGNLPKETATRKNASKEDLHNFHREHVKGERRPGSVGKRTVTETSPEQIKGLAVNAAKVLLPVAACAIIIAVVISHIGSRKTQTVDTSLNAEGQLDTAVAVTLSDEPLAENAHTNVNELMQTFCAALADGDMDTVRTIKDSNTEREIITYEKKSEFIERYDNIKCYTKPGMEEDSYFVYVTYEVKFKDIETKAPGLNAFYVYTAEDGSLKIDGDTEENIKAAFKLVTNQDDVVDLYNEINVSYTEATASDETLDQFMAELPVAIKESVGVALAQLETQTEAVDTPQTVTEETQPAETETPVESEETPQNQAVNQIVRTTDTVNVRSSDSEEADKIGKAQAGIELRRVEERVNGWSKVIFEDREAYIKSDYLEVVTSEETVETSGTVTATTNVNVRSEASQDSDRIGSAQSGTSYNLLEDQGEWYKIDFNGTTGYVKAEFFTR